MATAINHLLYRGYVGVIQIFLRNLQMKVCLANFLARGEKFCSFLGTVSSEIWFCVPQLQKFLLEVAIQLSIPVLPSVCTNWSLFLFYVVH